MLIGTMDESLILFNVDKLELLDTFYSPGGGVLRCEFLPVNRSTVGMGQFNERYLVSIVTASKRMALLEIDSGGRISAMGSTQKSGIFKQTYSNNGNMLANVSENGKVYIYNVPVLIKNFTKPIKGMGMRSVAVNKNRDEVKLIKKQVVQSVFLINE